MNNLWVATYLFCPLKIYFAPQTLKPGYGPEQEYMTVSFIYIGWLISQFLLEFLTNFPLVHLEVSTHHNDDETSDLGTWHHILGLLSKLLLKLLYVIEPLVICRIINRNWRFSITETLSRFSSRVQPTSCIAHQRQHLQGLYTLLYSSETWSINTQQQERKLKLSHALPPQHLWRRVEWQDEKWGHLAAHRLFVVACLGISKQGACADLVHVFRLSDCCLTKNILYGELISGTRIVDRLLRFRTTVKRDVWQLKILSSEWEPYTYVPTIVWPAGVHSFAKARWSPLSPFISKQSSSVIEILQHFYINGK